MTTGSRNVIIGAFSGNQGGLDIRTADNYIVLSDGAGNVPVLWDSSKTAVLYANPGSPQFSNTQAATLANGATVDYAAFSGFLMVNAWAGGGIAIWICGAGAVTLVSTVAGGAGSFAYNPGVNGYTWTSNSGTTQQYTFTAIRTRSNA
jgi:hypothetical protein